MDKEKILDIIQEHTREVLPELEEHIFQPTERLTDLGANSVDRAEIIMMTLETLALTIPRVELSGARNMRELAEILYEKMQLD